MFVAHSVCPFIKDLPLGDTFLRAMNFLHLETSLIFQKEYFQVSFQSQNLLLFAIMFSPVCMQFQQSNSSMQSIYLLTRLQLLTAFQ